MIRFLFLLDGPCHTAGTLPVQPACHGSWAPTMACSLTPGSVQQPALGGLGPELILCGTPSSGCHPGCRQALRLSQGIQNRTFMERSVLPVSSVSKKKEERGVVIPQQTTPTPEPRSQAPEGFSRSLSTPGKARPGSGRPCASASPSVGWTDGAGRCGSHLLVSLQVPGSDVQFEASTQKHVLPEFPFLSQNHKT